MRISRQMMFMMFARAASLRSTCFRLNVGAIITHRNNVIAIGYGGQPPGHPHCRGNDCPGVVPGNCTTIHAEVNALNKAAERLMAGVDVDLYTTHSPCPFCVCAIEASPLKVRNLFYETPYRLTDHLEVLKESVGVYNITPAGYIVDHFTRRVVEEV